MRMNKALNESILEKQNFVFVGEAGSGKSEVSLNFAVWLAQQGVKPVHFFDMDQTKPLFRSRDVKKQMESHGIVFHYEEQFFDSPTTVGGVNALLADPDCYVVMDVGGDHIGARLIGGFAPRINKDSTLVYYVLNSYRPWSREVMEIDGTLSSILAASHIQKVHFISNPNVGCFTTAEEVVSGHKRMQELVGEYVDIDFVCANEPLCETVSAQVDLPVMPVKLYLTYEWLETAANFERRIDANG